MNGGNAKIRKMETVTVIVIVILILALLFFGYSLMNSGGTGKASSSPSYPSGQFVGGGCGR